MARATSCSSGRKEAPRTPRYGGGPGGAGGGPRRPVPSPDPPRPRPPQFASWADAVIFVFSLENESSFEEVTQLHALLSGYRGAGEVALALVGTQGEPGTRDRPPSPPGRHGEGVTPASLRRSPQTRSAPPTRG